MVDAAGDYDYTNTASVTDDGGSNPTISDKAHPIIVSEGTGSGSGDCQFPTDAWNNVSDNTDIGVFDANDNALTFEIESLDTTNNEAVIWVFKSSLPRDNTDDVKVALGSGSTDDSDTEGTWGNTGQNAVMVQHLQDDPITATDSTSNNHDGSVTGTSSISAQYDGGVSFDGTDDEITVSDSSDFSPSVQPVTWVWWINPDSVSGSGLDDNIMIDKNDGGGSEYTIGIDSGEPVYYFLGGDNTAGTMPNMTSGSWQHLVMYFDRGSGSWEGWLDVNRNTYSNPADDTTGSNSEPLDIGFGSSRGTHISADMDALRIYNKPSAPSTDWVQADYDASPKAGQTLFSWNGAESTTTVVSATVSDNLNLSENTTAALAIDITGQVTLDGSGVSGANVYAYDETNEVFLSQDETDASGNYTIPNAPEGNEILIAVDYDSGTTRYGEEESIIAG